MTCPPGLVRRGHLLLQILHHIILLLDLVEMRRDVCSQPEFKKQLGEPVGKNSFKRERQGLQRVGKRRLGTRVQILLELVLDSTGSNMRKGFRAHTYETLGPGPKHSPWHLPSCRRPPETWAAGQRRTCSRGRSGR